MDKETMKAFVDEIKKANESGNLSVGQRLFGFIVDGEEYICLLWNRNDLSNSFPTTKLLESVNADFTLSVLTLTKRIMLEEKTLARKKLGRQAAVVEALKKIRAYLEVKDPNWNYCNENGYLITKSTLDKLLKFNCLRLS